jgi:tellurite resistance-related uncharacterized protein
LNNLCSHVGSKEETVATKLHKPAAAQPYKRLPKEGTFTTDTIPKGLLRRHNVKAGVWGEIHVVKGILELITLEETQDVENGNKTIPPETVQISAPAFGVVGPQQYHQVKPLTSDVEMFILFNNFPEVQVKGTGFG